MAIISKGGRRSWKIRLIYIVMYMILGAGAITMVYPFALMVGGSMTTPYDFDDFAIIPKYLYNDDALLKKYLHSKYGQINFQSFSFLYGKDCEWLNWNDIREVDHFAKNIYETEKVNFSNAPTRIYDWQEFKATIPAEEKGLFFENDRSYYQNFLRMHYMKDGHSEKEALEELNHNWGRSFNKFEEILPMASRLFEQRWYAPNRQDFNDYLSAIKSASPMYQQVVSLREMWARFLLKKYSSPENFQEATGRSIRNFSEVPLKIEPDWTQFLQQKYPLRLVSINGQGMPADFTLRGEWMDHLLKNIPVEKWELNDIASRFQSFLLRKYQSLDGINIAYGANYKSIAEIQIPFKLEDYHSFTTQKNQLRKSYFSSNYLLTISYLSTKGRAVSVTFILVVLAVGSALTVNPLAAYALSRGKQSISNKLLIFFLATMAFPAEVAMIPGFLLIRDLGLLNTFGALLLPSLANGYSIFLLKGFFDSIPRELYEAAEIDGAGEFTKFRVITLPMAKPILAVIALAAFNSSYGGFMWAFLTCQDPNMWTIMVWVYDLQSSTTDQGLIMASLVLASLPTLVVFIFCQKIIMRGIVIPTMK